MEVLGSSYAHLCLFALVSLLPYSLKNGIQYTILNAKSLQLTLLDNLQYFPNFYLLPNTYHLE